MPPGVPNPTLSDPGKWVDRSVIALLLLVMLIAAIVYPFRVVWWRITGTRPY